MAKGVLLFKGMRVGFLPEDLVISIGDDGNFESSLTLSTSYNVIPIWLRASLDNLNAAKIASINVKANWSNDTENQRLLLMAELAPSIQVFVSCGIVWDALYDILRPHTNIPKEEIEAWNKNKTSRAKQIYEIIRRIYNLQNPLAADFRSYLIRIVKLRDSAVHPSFTLQRARSRPDLDVGVDWKFAAYTYKNAEYCLTNTISMLSYFYEHTSEVESIDASIRSIVETLQELKVVKIDA